MVFDGAGTQLIDSGGTGAGNTFYDIIHSGTGTFQLSVNDLAVGNSLSNSAGTFDGNSLNVIVGTDLSVSGGTFTEGGGNVTVSGNFTLSAGTYTKLSLIHI